jgi:heptosyltransferase-1
MVHVISTKKWKKSLYKPQTLREIGQACQRLRQTSYAAALDLQGNVKSALIMQVLKAAKKIGFDKQSVSEWPAAYGLDAHLHTHHLKQVRDVYAQGFAKTFEETCGKSAKLTPFKASDLLWSEYAFSQETKALNNHAVVALGSRWINKQPEKALALPVIRMLLEESEQTLYMAFGSPEEKQMAQEIVQEIHHPRLKLFPAMSLVEYAYAIYRCKWLLSADSLPLHLAGFLDRPSFGLFGPSNDFYYGPQGKLHATWQGSCPYGESFIKRCSKLRTCATGACLRQAPSKPVIEAISKWLRNQAHHPS